MANFTYFLCLMDHCLSLLDAQYLEMHCFMYFIYFCVLFHFVFRQKEDKFSLISVTHMRPNQSHGVLT